MTELQVKQLVRARDGYRCTSCGMTQAEHLERRGRALHVHRSPPGSDYTEANCVTLCNDCHWQRHQGEHSPAALGAKYDTPKRLDRAILSVHLPAKLVTWLKQQAKQNRRRINQELQVILEAARRRERRKLVASVKSVEKRVNPPLTSPPVTSVG